MVVRIEVIVTVIELFWRRIDRVPVPGSVIVLSCVVKNRVPETTAVGDDIWYLITISWSMNMVAFRVEEKYSPRKKGEANVRSRVLGPFQILCGAVLQRRWGLSGHSLNAIAFSREPL